MKHRKHLRKSWQILLPMDGLILLAAAAGQRLIIFRAIAEAMKELPAKEHAEQSMPYGFRH